MLGSVWPIPGLSRVRKTGYMEPISIQHLSKKYGEHTVVDRVTFTVTRGECVALLGPNGAGKTTTVEILEGFRRPTSGTAMVLGENPAKAGPKWRNRVGVVLQSTFEASSLTVREELIMASTSYSDPMPVGDVLAMVGLEAKARSNVAKLSGGQRRRLDVALGLIGRPEILFLDEPTTGFDPVARLEFQQMINDLHQSGITIMLTTHYLEEASVLADRVIVLNHGKVVAEGPPGDLGGSEAHLPRVQWRDPGSGLLRQEITTNPTALVRSLAQKYEEVPELQVIRPTLEEVYLQLIGEGAAA